ncbi:MAG TPA: putative lipid II flippase FtsW [Clostridia bacterium]|nr:putative lipid II flippase FtsW [Clostridia bacterium]
MAKRVSVDRWLFGVTLLLVVIGLVMVFSASAVVANERYDSPYYFLFRQLIWAVAGLIGMIVLMNIDYRRYNNPVVVFGCIAFTSILLVSVFFLDRSHNTHRWIRFGMFSFQPSELAKPTLILFLAWFLAERFKDIDDWRHTLLPAALPTMVFTALIVKQPDLGTAMACFAITAAVLFTAGMHWKWLGYAALASVLPLYFLIFRTPWRFKRILAFLDPFADPQGSGFHIIQSMIAVGTGGVTGLGLMEGKQKLFYLPEPQTDFIFAVIAEEWGLIGATIVVALFAVFCFRGIRTALTTRDSFARFLAVGITAMIGVQALFNISVVLGMLPTKGIPLPFVSYGGSSLFISLVSVGVLLNITRQTD